MGHKNLLLFHYYVSIFLLFKVVSSALIDFESVGGIPEDLSEVTAWHNGRLLNQTLNSLQPGDVFFISNKTFMTMGGIKAANLNSVTFQLDGTLVFSDNMDDWPRYESGKVLNCLAFDYCQNITFTSSGLGTLEGQGATGWGIPGIGYLEIGENRPKLFEMDYGKDILVENWFFKDSPYWTFWVHHVDGLEVRYCNIDV